jgi:hypothetical protein
MKTFEERFAEFFAEQDPATQMGIYNEYAYATGYEPIWYMEELNDVCGEMCAGDLAFKIFYGDFNPNHNYFTFDGYANLESIERVDWWLESYEEDLADWYEDRARTLADVVGFDAYDLYEDEEDEEDEEADPEA